MSQPDASCCTNSRHWPPVAETSKKSYGQILKSSALIGGSTAFNMVFSIVRNKAMALLLGTVGLWLAEFYTFRFPIWFAALPGLALIPVACGRLRRRSVPVTRSESLER